MILAGVANRLPYLSFLQNIDGLTANDDVGSTGDNAANDPSVVSSLAASGSMWGSPYNFSVNGYTDDSALNRIIQHGVEDQAAWDGLVNNNSRVYKNTYFWGSHSSFNSVNRNGYTSNSFGSPFNLNGIAAAGLKYWDFGRNKARQNTNTSVNAWEDYTWTP